MTSTADGGSQVRKYRGSLWLTVFLAVLLFCCAGLLASFAVLLVVVAEAPVVVAIPLGAFAAVVFALMLAFVRSVTIVDQDHITVRDFGTRRTAWRDIIAIEIEDNRGGAVEGAKPVECVAIYTRDGRRIVLPNLTGSRKLAVSSSWPPSPAGGAGTGDGAGAGAGSRWRSEGLCGRPSELRPTVPRR